MDARRLDYLEAMGLPVWLLRDRAAGEAALLRLGPGEGAALFVCADATLAARPLAADLERALRQAPVWAWPDADEAALSVHSAIGERLFTAVVVFGEQLAQRLFGGSVPESSGSARIVVVADIEQLEANDLARRACWQAFTARGIIARQ